MCERGGSPNTCPRARVDWTISIMRGYLLKPEGLIPTCACVSFAFVFVCIFGYALLSPDAAVTKKSQQKADFAFLRPVVLVTLGWNALYFCFLQGQAAAAFWIHRQLREAGSPKARDDEPKQSKVITFASVKYGSDHSNG